MQTNKKFFDDLLRDRRMSLRQLAKRLDILPSQISLTFNGKRRMQISEAVRIAQILGAPLNEVMLNAGIEEVRTDRNRVTITGYLNGKYEVVPADPNAVERTLLPDGLPADSRAIQCRTVGTPNAWTDGWMLFTNGKQDPEELLGAFCVAKIQGGKEVVGTLSKGYEPGTYSLHGPVQRTSQRIEWAARILLTRH